MPGLKQKPLKYEQDIAKFDLSLAVFEQGRSQSGTMVFNRHLFNKTTIQRMAVHFKEVLRAIASHPDRSISGISVLTQAEQKQLLVQWNQTQVTLPDSCLIHQWVEDQVRRTPDRIALVTDLPLNARHRSARRQLSYREMDRRAEKLAIHLQYLGAGPDVLIAICAERSAELVVGLLAILKAGAAYVPLDPAYPEQRLAFMLADGKVPILLTAEKTASKLTFPGTKTVLLGEQIPSAGTQQNSLNAAKADSENLAYAIYTSGSTGTPKGVLNSHGGIANRLWWMSQNHPAVETECVLQKTPISFDVSVWELFWPLQSGSLAGDGRTRTSRRSRLSGRCHLTAEGVQSAFRSFHVAGVSGRG